MKFKLITVMCADDKTDLVVETARDSGATGCTVVTNARGEGLKPVSTFLGLTLEGHRDIIFLLVEEHLSRKVLEEVSEKAHFEDQHGTGIAFQLDIEDAVGLGSQISTIKEEIEDEL